MVLNGRILKILDEYRVVVDIGYNQGIKEDMKFLIYSLGEEILDPDTNELIDHIEIVKHRLKVIHIQEKISIMKSDEYEVIPTGPFSYPVVKDFLEPATRNIPLDIDTKHLKSSEKGSKKVKVGDLVRQIVD